MAKRKSPEPYKRLREPEFNYIASIIRDEGGSNADIARRTGRSDSTIARIRATETWQRYNASPKITIKRISSGEVVPTGKKKKPGEPKPQRMAKSTTNQPSLLQEDKNVDKTQLSGIHKHLGRLERLVNENYAHMTRTDKHLTVILNDAIIATLNQKDDFRSIQKTLGGIVIVVWVTFFLAAILLFIVVRALYV